MVDDVVSEVDLRLVYSVAEIACGQRLISEVNFPASKCTV